MVEIGVPVRYAPVGPLFYAQLYSYKKSTFEGVLNVFALQKWLQNHQKADGFGL